MFSTYIFPKRQNFPEKSFSEVRFTAEEIAKICEEAEKIPAQEAKIVEDGVEKDADKSVRSSTIRWIPKTAEWRWVYRRLMETAIMANEKLWNFDLSSVIEEIQFTEYHASEEGHYDWHQDIGSGIQSLRKISITIQLSNSDDYEGGDLMCYSGGNNYITAPRDLGTAFVFPSYMLHKVNKVTKGTRRSLVLWVGGEPFK